MACEFIPMPGGGHAIICGRSTKRPRCRSCGRPAGLACDWKMPRKKSGCCISEISPILFSEIRCGRNGSRRQRRSNCLRRARGFISSSPGQFIQSSPWQSARILRAIRSPIDREGQPRRYGCPMASDLERIARNIYADEVEGQGPAWANAAASIRAGFSNVWISAAIAAIGEALINTPEDFAP